MRKFVAIIGNRNSGKSTVIKSLTGCPTNSFRGPIEDKATGKTIHVICSSPQEQPLSLPEFRKRVQAAARDPNSQGLVMAVQPSEPNKRLSMETILQEVASTGMFEIHAYVLDPGRMGPKTTAAAVAARTKPLGVKPKTLDGQRFAHINAQAINRATRVAS